MSDLHARIDQLAQVFEPSCRHRAWCDCKPTPSALCEKHRDDLLRAVKATFDALAVASDAMIGTGNEYSHPSAIWCAMLEASREELGL